MMGGNLVETLIGAVVLAVAGVFLLFAYTKADLGSHDGYKLYALFDKADGIRVGSDVTLSGIKIGSVVEQGLDRRTLQARITISVEDWIKLPTDTAIKITSDGLLGDRYLALIPGGLDEVLAPGDEIEHAQGAIDLTDLIGKAIYSVGEGKE